MCLFADGLGQCEGVTTASVVSSARCFCQGDPGCAPTFLLRLFFSHKLCNYYYKVVTCALEIAKNHDFFEAKKWHDLPGVWLNHGDGCDHEVPVDVWCSECHAVMICLYRARIIQALWVMICQESTPSLS